mgnify:CR=1 FL=1
MDENNKVYCGGCANKWCGHNGTYQTCFCKDFYPRTYIQTKKVGEKAVDGYGWYDDRTQDFKFEIYNYD